LENAVACPPAEPSESHPGAMDARAVDHGRPLVVGSNKGKHRDDPRPFFLVPDHVPTGLNWTKLRPLSTSNVRTVKIRSIHFSEIGNVLFYQTEPKRVPETQRLILRAAAKKKLTKVLEDNLKSTKLRLKRRFRARPKKD